MKSYSGLDLFVSAGTSFEQCLAVIDDLLKLGRDQFVPAEDLDELLAAIDRSAAGWVVCHRSENKSYPYHFDLTVIDGRSTLAIVPDIARRLGVAVVVPDDRRGDPYAGLRFAPDQRARPCSLLGVIG